MRHFILALITIFTFMIGQGGNVALANGQCYNLIEAEAEQGLRIHSELMVIGLNCQHMTPRGWKNFYQEYREITARHKSLLGDYEKILLKHYASAGGERKLHNLRTNFANKTATDAAKMRPDVFCARFAPRIPKVGKMNRTQLQQWASSTSQSQRLSKPVCE